jgi:hypothetical protein
MIMKSVETKEQPISLAREVPHPLPENNNTASHEDASVPITALYIFTV